jgi:hypothetical protein
MNLHGSEYPFKLSHSPRKIHRIDAPRRMRYPSQPMSRPTPALLLISFLLLIQTALAQVSVDLRLPRRTFLNGETIPLTVSISNLSGDSLRFQGTARQPWIDFIVKSSRGVPLIPTGRAAIGRIEIPAGKTLGRTIDLNQLFSFSELGNYSIYAIVRLPDQRTGGFQSRRHLFNIATAKPSWSQVVGVPGKKGQNHEMRLVRFSSDRKDRLYAQVADQKTGRILRTHHLGEALSLRKPSVALDQQLHMHVLYLATPSFWGHVEVSPEGKLVRQDIYRPGPGGAPQLARLTSGQVKPVGGILYDPDAAAKARKNTRKASDRPDFAEP